LIFGILFCSLLSPADAGKWLFRVHQGYAAAAAEAMK
jgi:hypothetical protein